MNGVDYTKQLAREREYYQDANRKLKSAAEKQIAHTEERANHVIEKQKSNHIADKAELESSYQKNLNHLKEKTRSALDNSGNRYAADMAKEREAFTQESLKKSKDFDQRLGDIKSSYQKAFDSEKGRHIELTDAQKVKYNKNISDIDAKTTKQLKNYQDKLTSTGANLKDQYDQERQQLVRSHEEHVTNVHKDSAKKRAELRDRISSDLAKTKEVYTQEQESQKEYALDRMATMQRKYQDRFDAMAEDYSHRHDHIAKTQQQEAIKTNREQQKQIAEVRRDYNQKLRQIDLEKRRRDNGSGEFAEVMDRQKGLKDQVIHENRVKSLQNQINEIKTAYKNKSEADHEIYRETLKRESTEATATMDKKVNNVVADKLITVSRERQRTENEIANREHQNRLDKTAYEQQLMIERNNATIRLNKLKENFNKSMTALEENNKANIEEVTKTSNKDKHEYMKQLQERRNEELFAMKREFTKMLDATVQDYEQRLGNYQRDNEYLKMTMDQKIKNITDQSEKNLESQRKMFEERRTADLRGHQDLLDQKESQLKASINQLNISYQKKMDKMLNENNTRLKLITNEYENKLKELKATSSKDLVAKDASHQTELAIIKQTFNDEKQRLVAAYENQIQSLKNGHREQMDQMKNFKNLS